MRTSNVYQNALEAIKAGESRIMINGKMVYVKHSKQGTYWLKVWRNNRGKNLYQFYAKPSTTKQAIYREYAHWASDSEYLFDLGVYYGNCYTFGMLAAFIVPDSGEIIGVLRITPSADTLYIL